MQFKTAFQFSPISLAKTERIDDIQYRWWFKKTGSLLLGVDFFGGSAGLSGLALESALQFGWGPVRQQCTYSAGSLQPSRWSASQRPGAGAPGVPSRTCLGQSPDVERLFLEAGWDFLFPWNQLKGGSHLESNIKPFFLWYKFKLAKKFKITKNKSSMKMSTLYPSSPVTVLPYLLYHLCHLSP